MNTNDSSNIFCLRYVFIQQMWLFQLIIFPLMIIALKILEVRREYLKPYIYFHKVCVGIVCGSSIF